MTAPNDKRVLPYGGSFSIQDSSVIEYIKQLDLSQCLWKEDITYNFCNKYLEWIHSTKNNLLIGLEDFKHVVFSNGTSQAFDMFYIKNKNRRFRCFKGEYIYHQLAWRNNWSDWSFIEDGVLESNDAVVISTPFSDTGNLHPKTKWLLNACSDLGIPVLVDCAYFGVCSNITFDFNHNCITDIAFSLSKTFPVAHARIGIRLTRQDNDDLMLVYNKINYNNRMSAEIGLKLIEKYSPDYIYEKYRSQQQDLCEFLDLEQSNTVLFGLDYKNNYPEYNRGNESNRLGLHKKYEV